MHLYTWRTDSAGGEIQAADPKQAVDKLTLEGEWFPGAETHGGWLTIFDDRVPVLTIGQMP